jgi:hypothetical protein
VTTSGKTHDISGGVTAQPWLTALLDAVRHAATTGEDRLLLAACGTPHLTEPWHERRDHYQRTALTTCAAPGAAPGDGLLLLQAHKCAILWAQDIIRPYVSTPEQMIEADSSAITDTLIAVFTAEFAAHGFHHAQRLAQFCELAANLAVATEHADRQLGKR